jgi:hypothetical protein
MTSLLLTLLPIAITFGYAALQPQPCPRGGKRAADLVCEG